MGRVRKQSNPIEINGSWIPSGDDGPGGSNSGPQPVTWTNAVDVAANGNNLTATGGYWAAGAVSTQTFSGDGYVETTINETNTYRMIGLSNGDANQSYVDIDFAFYPAAGGGLYIYEQGAYIGYFGTYTTGDVLRVAVENGAVKYRKNGLAVHTSTTAPTYPLLVDTSFYNPGSTLNSVKISGPSSPGGWIYTEQTYDWKGRPLRTTTQDGSYREASYEGCTCAGSEVVTLTDEMTRRQKVYSDVLGRQWKTEVLNSNGPTLTTTSSFNARDQVTNVHQIDNATSVFQDTTMDYDGYGRLWKKHVPEQDVATPTVYTYRSDDTVESITDARGASATYIYNHNRHLVDEVHYSAPGGITAAANLTFTYDQVGNRTSMTDGLGSKSYAYNQLSQMTSETRNISSVGSFTLTYNDYNFAGELKTFTDSTGVTINYGFDTLGRVNSVTGSNVLVGGVTTYASGFAYRATGNLKQISTGGQTATMGYDWRLQANSFSIPGVVNETFEYAGDGRLSFLHNTTDNKFDRAFTYDHVGRLVEVSSGGLARNDSGDVPMYETFYYSTFNNTTSRYTNSWGNEYYDSSSYTNNRRGDWGYDADGRIATIDTRTYAYNSAGQNFSVTGQRWTPGNNYVPTSTTSDFDGDGNRIREVANDNGTVTTTYYLRSSVLGNVVEELNSGGTKQTGYVYAPGGGLLATQMMVTNSVIFTQVSPTGFSQYEFFSESYGSVHRNEFDPAGATVPLFNHSPGHGGSAGEMPDGGGER
jgi:YD repeat-containing protein